MCFLCCLCSKGTAQVAQTRFQHFPPDNVLSHSSITAMLQDYRGFLWVGTWSGLMRYDGYNVIQYKQEPGNVNGLETNKINCMFQDSKNRLWIGTQNSGLYLYDRERDVFIHYGHESNNSNSLSDNRVWTIHEDHCGMFWIGTEHGLNYFDAENESFVHFTHIEIDQRSISFDFIYSICESPDHTLWVGTEDGLNRLVRNKYGEPDYFIRYSLADDYGVGIQGSHNYIYKVKPIEGKSNELWAGTKSGLKRIKYNAANITDFHVEEFTADAKANSISHNYVVDFEQQDEDHLWVATYCGLNLMNIKTGVFTSFLAREFQEDGLNNNLIRSLYIDPTENLWVGTEGGLHKIGLQSKPFIHVRPNRQAVAGSMVVTSILETSDKHGIWLATRGGGLHYADLKKSGSVPERTPIHAKYSPESAGFISDISRDPYGNIWISTLGSGAFRISEKELLSGQVAKSEQFSMGKGLINVSAEHIMTVMASEPSAVWFGGWDFGIVRYDQKKKKWNKFPVTSDYKGNLVAYPVVHLHEWNENGVAYVLAGTRGAGLFKLKYDESNEHLLVVDHFKSDYSKEGMISNNYINCLFTDPNGVLWIGTENGLNRYDSETKQFHYLLERDGLPFGNIQAIQSDDDGRIWVSTLRGISCLSFSNEYTLQSIKHYDAYDGLQANYFNDDAMCRTSSGDLIFGGMNGLTRFDPRLINEDPFAPNMVISGIRVGNKPIQTDQRSGKHVILESSIPEADKIELAHFDNVLSFEFAGIHFTNPQKVVYAHMLEGLDKDWVYSNAQERIAHYTNIPFGEYTFRVKASNEDGVWSEEAQLPVIIHPPFWATGWAYFLYALCALGIFLVIRKIVNIRREYKQNIQMERLEREKLEEVNQLKLRFFTNISHELRTPLTLILSPLQQLLREQNLPKKLQHSYTQMHSNANKLLNMINQLLDLRKSDAGLMRVNVQETNLIPFVQEIVHSFKALAKQREIHLKFTHAMPDCYVWIDHDQMEKALYNLLSNAFKYTQAQGAIQVKICDKPRDLSPEIQTDSVVIMVKDSGCGIDASHLPFIFDRFYRVEDSQTNHRYSEGTGIGLALAKNIMESHHGKIWVESVPGKGTTFSLALAKGDTHFTSSEKFTGQAIQKTTLNNDEVLEGVHLSDHDISPSPSIEDKRKQGSPVILLVDDNHEIRQYLKENLEDHYHIIEAANGELGLEAVKRDNPDLVVADVAMPVMDGIEMCKMIKQDVHLSHIPVILLTARASLESKLEGFDIGADEYLTKPFNMHLLQTRILNLIESRTQLKEKFARSFDLSPTGVEVSPLDETLMNQMREIIEKHMDDSSFSVEDLAAGLFMSRMQLYRKLKTLLGQSPNQIIRTIRLKRAAQLLETHQYNVSDVTYMVGYNDLKSFRDQFKKEFGVSPSEYESKHVNT